MFRGFMICLFLASNVLTSNLVAQSTGTTSAPVQTTDSPKNEAPPNTLPEQQFPADKVPQDAVIITIPGVCPNHLSTKPAECKTTLTRAQFEEMLDVVKPHAPQAARRLIAITYSQALAKEQKALEMGLDRHPDYAGRAEVQRLLVSHEMLDEAQDKQAWDSISDKQVEDYYRNNPAEFVQVDAERVFLPWFEPDENKGLPEAEKDKRDLEWQQKLKEEADKLHARAVAGEDCVELQKEAYKFTGVSQDVDRSSITLPRTRRIMLTPALMPLMDLEPGQVSAVLTEDNGYYIFKATKKASMPFDSRTIREIRTKFRDEVLAKDKAELAKTIAASVTYNDNYFGPPTPPANVKTSPGYDVMPVPKQP